MKVMDNHINTEKEDFRSCDAFQKLCTIATLQDGAPMLTREPAITAIPNGRVFRTSVTEDGVQRVQICLPGSDPLSCLYELKPSNVVSVRWGKCQKGFGLIISLRVSGQPKDITLECIKWFTDATNAYIRSQVFDVEREELKEGDSFKEDGEYRVISLSESKGVVEVRYTGYSCTAWWIEGATATDKYKRMSAHYFWVMMQRHSTISMDAVKVQNFIASMEEGRKSGDLTIMLGIGSGWMRYVVNSLEVLDEPTGVEKPGLYLVLDLIYQEGAVKHYVRMDKIRNVYAVEGTIVFDIFSEFPVILGVLKKDGNKMVNIGLQDIPEIAEMLADLTQRAPETTSNGEAIRPEGESSAGMQSRMREFWVQSPCTESLSEQLRKKQEEAMQKLEACKVASDDEWEDIVTLPDAEEKELSGVYEGELKKVVDYNKGVIAGIKAAGKLPSGAAIPRTVFGTCPDYAAKEDVECKEAAKEEPFDCSAGITIDSTQASQILKNVVSANPAGTAVGTAIGSTPTVYIKRLTYCAQPLEASWESLIATMIAYPGHLNLHLSDGSQLEKAYCVAIHGSCLHILTEYLEWTIANSDESLRQNGFSIVDSWRLGKEDVYVFELKDRDGEKFALFVSWYKDAKCDIDVSGRIKASTRPFLVERARRLTKTSVRFYDTWTMREDAEVSDVTMLVGGISVVGSYSAIKGEDKITVEVDAMTDIFDSSGGYEHTQPIISREGGKIVTVFDAIGFGTLRHSVTSSPEKVKVARDSIGACFFLGKIPTSSPAGVALELHAGAVIAAGLTAYMDTTKFIPEFLKECPPDALKYASIGSVRIAADTLKRFYAIESIRQDIVEVLLEEKEASCAVTYSKQAGLFPVCIVPATQMEGRQECDKAGQSYLREYVLPNLVASGLCRLDGVSCQFLGCVLGQDCRAYMSVMKAGHILLIPVDSVSCSYREYDDKVEVIWLEKGTMYSLYLYMEDHKKSVTYHALSKHSDTGMVYGISELAPYVASADYRDSLESKISTRRLRAKERVANMCKYVTLGRELNTVEVLDKYFVVIATADVSKDGIIKVAGSSYKACSPIYYTKDELPTEIPYSTRNPLI